ncbi:MAG TPA: translation initiation factor IF-2 [Firmicutes bacterium]|jgi:translation initiation factor IF-2|nr:translation initiation factor IF-2 [Bacillota bacterium]
MQKKNQYQKNNTTKVRQSNVRGTLAKSEKAKVSSGVFVYTGEIGISELSEKINIPVNEIVKYLFLNGKMFTINSKLDDECVGMVCLNFGLDFKKEKAIEEENIEEYDIVDDLKSLKERPPVVTIMGHVDHGKTTLIDAIRSSNLVAGEFGGISQAIGAYQRDFNGKKITFIDTPGHEAFTAMRSRGASVTDIIILVVAADDGVMPQTREAIDHAKAANVPLIVAINKMDKASANPKRVKDELMQLGIVAEEFGGEHIFLEISAKFNRGIDTLLENILTLSEMLELKANPDRYAYGTVLEAVLDKGEGPKATLLVQNGTLKSSDYVVVGAAYGKVRRMTNEFQKIVKVAPPSTPVSIIGLSELPIAGDHFMAFSTEKQARDIASKRKLKLDATKLAGSAAASMEDLNERFLKGEVQDLNLIIKADNTGSAEALKSSLEKIDVKGIKLNIIRCSTGAITESDILLANASSAIIYGFNVRPSANIRAMADEEKVEIRLHRIIYALIEEIEAACKGMLKPVQVEQVTGQAEVRQIFKVSKIGTIAGSMVISGSIKANNPIRLIRDGVVIFEGKIASMKRYQADIKEANTGYDCGIVLENYHDTKENDIIEGYQMVDVAAK